MPIIKRKLFGMIENETREKPVPLHKHVKTILALKPIDASRIPRKAERKCTGIMW